MSALELEEKLELLVDNDGSSCTPGILICALPWTTVFILVCADSVDGIMVSAALCNSCLEQALVVCTYIGETGRR